MLDSKPGMWRDWKDRDFHELESLCRQMERELAEANERIDACEKGWAADTAAPSETGDSKDAARYRELRDSGIAVSAWQDIDGVHWAINGVEYMDLDDGADALLRRKK